MDHAANPLLQPWTTPFHLPPFDTIESAHYLPAFREAMRRQRDEVEAIAASAAPATFENTVEALERCGADLRRLRRVFSAVEIAHTDDVLRATNREISPELARHEDAILFDDRLYGRIRTVFERRDALDLDDEGRRLLDETHKRYVRAGAALDAEAKARLTEINAELATLGQRFGENLLEETNDFALHVTDEADLGDLPSTPRAAAADEARRRGFDVGWAITLQRPSCGAFLESSPNRALRERVFEGYIDRGRRGNAHDNRALLARMAALRAERARMLGHPTHAHHVLDDSMAETPERVRDLLDRVWRPALRTAEEERAALQEAMAADGIDAPLAPWDWPYYAARLRAARFDLDEERTRPYFELTAVRDGCFAVARRLFGVELVRVENAPTWHPDQQVFEVLDADGEHVGVLMMDFFARPTKTAGAWMTELVEQHRTVDGTRIAPIVTNNFNFSPPSGDAPSLLSFEEATTLFHEFGHALHGLFSDVRYASLSGTNVPRDFVEFPSQVFENWLTQPEVLRDFARHHVTDEPIPESMIERIRAAATAGQGFATVEYLAAAQLDLAWHTLGPEDAVVDDVDAFERDTLTRIGMIDAIVPRYRSTYFAHVFAGGYAASYYSYLWSEVLDADAFAAFRDAGLFDRALAGRLRRALSRGGTAPGMDLYVEFRGHEPAIDPLLERRGFVATES